MSKSITLLGATYTGVPAVDLPQTGGGTARFVEPSDTTATAEDVAEGKYFYTAAGVLTEGTATAGGGLDYESGTWTPTADVANYEISFTNSHNTPPFFYAVTDASGASNLTNTNFVMVYLDAYQLGGYGYPYGADTVRYSAITFLYRSTGTNSTYGLFRTSHPSDVAPQGNGYSQYWANSSRIRAYTNATNRYWRSTRTYKWIAVWMPTT